MCYVFTLHELILIAVVLENNGGQKKTFVFQKIVLDILS